MAAAGMVEQRELAQQIVDRGADPPLIYFQKDEIMQGVAEGTLRTIDLLEIDISLLKSPSPAVAIAEAEKLAVALSTYGCFLAVNHGMTSDFIEEVRGMMEDFFHVPVEDKYKLKSKCVGPADDEGNMDGYGFEETPEDGGSQEWCDRLVIITSPESQRKMQYWPDAKPPNFRKVTEEYSKKIERLLEEVLKGMAAALKLEDENSLVEEIGSEPRISARFNFYPKCSRPDKVLGVNSHTDGSVLTFLLPDKHVEGLQLLLDDGEWVRVPVTTPDTLVINLGDQGEIISNGAYKSRLHRAVVNSDRERKSLAMFVLSELDKTIGPAKGLVTDTTPARYKKVTNYEVAFLEQAYHRAFVDSLKI